MNSSSKPASWLRETAFAPTLTLPAMRGISVLLEDRSQPGGDVLRAAPRLPLFHRRLLALRLPAVLRQVDLAGPVVGGMHRVRVRPSGALRRLVCHGLLPPASVVAERAVGRTSVMATAAAVAVSALLCGAREHRPVAGRLAAPLDDGVQVRTARTAPARLAPHEQPEQVLRAEPGRGRRRRPADLRDEEKH